MGEAAEAPGPGVDVLYRVYTRKAEMPPLEKLLGRLTSGNPHNPPGSFVFPPGKGLRRLQDALGASADYFVMGYTTEEAPDLFASARAALAAGLGPSLDDEDQTAVYQAKLCVVLRARIASPESNDYIETLTHVTDALADLLDGVVWDVRMQVLWGRSEWRQRVMDEPFTILNHVSVHRVKAGAAAGGNGGGASQTGPDAGRRPGSVHTHGLRKFGSPDLEVLTVPDGPAALDVEGLLRDIAEDVAQGEVLGPDEVLDYGIGRVRTIAAPPPAEGENDLLRLVDEDAPEGDDGGHGLPKLIARMHERRTEGGGRSARDTQNT